MSGFPTPSDISGNVLIEITCPSELIGIVIGALEDETEVRDFIQVGDLTPEETAQLMGTVISLIQIRPLPGVLLMGVGGFYLRGVGGRLLYSGVET